MPSTENQQFFRKSIELILTLTPSQFNELKSLTVFLAVHVLIEISVRHDVIIEE
jgi:hypothetical protein